MAPSSDHPHPINSRKLPQPPHTTAGVAVVMVPLPAQGHLNQLLHFSRFITSYHIPVHYVAATTHLHQAKLRLHGWDPSTAADSQLLHFHGFEIPHFPSPPPNPNSPCKFPSQLMPAMEASASYLRRHVAALVGSLALRYRRVVVIHDSLMASTIQDVFSAGNVESYIFQSVSAFSIYWYIARTAGKQLTLGEYDDRVFLDDPPPLEVCFSAEFLKFVELQYKFRHLASGFLYNTSRVVEGRFMELLEKETVNQKYWAVGPFNPVKLPSPPSPNTKPPQEHVKHRCIQWLDRHPQNSVIYVSFGTTVTLTNDQINQIATALENSGQRFVWVLREADKGDIFENGTEVALPLMMLPKGFEDRVEGTGLVVKGWAPQLEILGHAAVGGFLSHCGWNSCVESMSMGVPMVAWPMHSDQPCNSLLVTKVLKIGLDVEARWSPAGALCSGRVVEAASIERAVRVLMDSEKGDGMRRRAAELGQAVRGSVEKGGVSTAELDAFVSHISR